MPTDGETPPPSTSHTTLHQQHMYLPASRRPREAPASYDRSRSSLPRFRMQLTHCRLWPWCKLVSVCRIYVSRRRCVGRHVLLLVWRGVGCAGWRGSLRTSAFSYGGHRVKLWRASHWLKNDKKQLKVKQSRQTRVYLGFIRPKTGTMRFGPMAGLVGCAFDLILECTRLWPQTDQVYLFLADAIHNC